MMDLPSMVDLVNMVKALYENRPGEKKPAYITDYVYTQDNGFYVLLSNGEEYTFYPDGRR